MTEQAVVQNELPSQVSETKLGTTNRDEQLEAIANQVAQQVTEQVAEQVAKKITDRIDDVEQNKPNVTPLTR